MQPWSSELAGQIEEHVLVSALLAGTRSATRRSGRCGYTCRPATTTSPIGASLPST
jgi:hypothetical protein